MPSASLIPDRQLTFSPELAETIGLEEAVLLQTLASQGKVDPSVVRDAYERLDVGDPTATLGIAQEGGDA